MSMANNLFGLGGRENSFYPLFEGRYPNLSVFNKRFYVGGILVSVRSFVQLLELICVCHTQYRLESGLSNYSSLFLAIDCANMFLVCKGGVSIFI